MAGTGSWSNRIDSTVSLIDTQDTKIVGNDRCAGWTGFPLRDFTADGKEMWITQRFLRRVAVVDLEQMKRGRQRLGRKVAPRRLLPRG